MLNFRLKVFISSVQNEFPKEREILYDYLQTDSLLKQFFDPFIFEKTPANRNSSKSVYLKEVEQCDIYLGIMGKQYGHEDKEGISPTEREYNHATLHQKSRLIFIKNIGKENRDPKESAFIRKIEQEVVRKTFVNKETLKTAVYDSLIRYLEEKEYIKFTPFDATTENAATLRDLDEVKMKNFLHMARKKRHFPLPSNTSPRKLLTHLNLMKEDGRLTNSALLLFGKNPQKFFPTSEIKCAQFYGPQKTKPLPAYQTFKGDVFELVDQATDFVMSRVNNWVGTRSNTGSASVPTRSELPIDAVKEAIVNAVCHRDYTGKASVEVLLFSDRVEIHNPGLLPSCLPVSMLYKTHSSLPSNPLLAEPMYLNGYIEKLGTGTEDILEKCAEYGLKRPEFSQENGFKTIIWRKPSTKQAIPPTPTTGRSKTTAKLENKVIRLLKKNPKISRADLAIQLQVSERQIRNTLSRLQAEGNLTRVGGKNGEWTF